MDLLERMGRVLRSPAFKVLLILLLIVLLLIPLLLVYGLIWERESRAQGVRARGRPPVGTRAAAARALPGGALHGAHRDGAGRQAHRADPGAPGRVHARDPGGRGPRRRQDPAPLDLRGAGLCRAAEALGTLRRRRASPTSPPRWWRCGGAMSRSCSGCRASPGSRRRRSSRLPVPAPPSCPSRRASASRRPTFPASMPSSPGAGARCCPIPSSRRRPSPLRSISPSTAPSRSRSRRSRARRACRSPPIGRIRASPALSCRTSGRSRPQGFTAAWRIPHLARSVPEAWSLAETGLERLQPYAFGVTLIDPVDFYSLVNRAAKYGIMFVAMAFMAVFCLEIVSGRPRASGAVPVHRHRAGLLLRAPAVAGGAPGVRPGLSRGLDGDRRRCSPSMSGRRCRARRGDW